MIVSNCKLIGELNQSGVMIKIYVTPSKAVVMLSFKGEDLIEVKQL